MGICSKEFILGKQCPYSGNTHFYSELITTENDNGGSVNALTRAILISTDKKGYTSTFLLWCVSMPLLGQYSFLLRRMLEKKVLIGCVNALTRAILISTVLKGDKEGEKYAVSMPLLGQYSFLLVNAINISTELTGGVNALTRAILISTELNELL